MTGVDETSVPATQRSAQVIDVSGNRVKSNYSPAQIRLWCRHMSVNSQPSRALRARLDHRHRRFVCAWPNLAIDAGGVPAPPLSSGLTMQPSQLLAASEYKKV